MAAVMLAAAWPISVYTAYGWEAALVHAPIAAAIYIMLLNALVMPLLGIHSARNDHPPRRYSGIAPGGGNLLHPASSIRKIFARQAA